VHEPRIIAGIRLLKEFVDDSHEAFMILIDVRMANAEVVTQGYHSHLQSPRSHHFIVILQTWVCRRQTRGAALDRDLTDDEMGGEAEISVSARTREAVSAPVVLVDRALGCL
jgi:hypothetical protein